jgi:hypothetical protein
MSVCILEQRKEPPARETRKRAIVFAGPKIPDFGGVDRPDFGVLGSTLDSWLPSSNAFPPSGEAASSLTSFEVCQLELYTCLKVVDPRTTGCQS